MAIDVDIPILIRTDPKSLDDHSEAVVEATRAALARVFARSRAEVLDGVGGYLGVDLDAPQVRWTGRDAAQVPVATRLRLEGALERTIAAQAAETGLFDYVDAAAVTPDPLSAPAAERVDEERFHRMLRHYRVPSYEGGSEWLHVDYRSMAQAAGWTFSWGTQARRSPMQMAGQLGYRLPVHDELYAKFPNLQALPEGGAFGFMGLSDGRGATAMPWVIVFTKDKGKTWHGLEFNGFHEHHPQKDGKLKAELKPPPVANAIATWIDKPAAVPEGLALLNERFGSGLKQEIGRQVDALESQVRADDRLEAIDLTVGAYLNEMWKGLDSSPALLSVEIGDRRLLLGMSAAAAAVKWEGDAYLMPLYHLAKTGKQAKGGSGQGGSGQGGEGGAGKGQGAGKGGEKGGKGDEGGRSGPGEGGDEAGAKPYYPTAKLALFHHELTCESFEGELPIDALPGADHIKSLMETIAFRLQIDYCGYAANFCVNAAMAVSARARAVGQHAGEDKSAAYYTDPARSGNLGILQFVPTVSTAIRTMRYLAETCGMLDELCNLILRYAESRSAHLFPAGHEYHYDTDSVGWRRRFLEAYSPEISASVSDMFKMTCRILMLQMLKSSKAEIQKRLDHFDSYRPFFEMLMITMFQRAGELDKMRERLQSHIALQSAGVDDRPVGQDPAAAWTGASDALVNLLAGGRNLAAGGGKEGDFIDGPKGSRIVDSLGVAWSIEEIDIAQIFARGNAEDVDPMVKQMGNIPELMDEFRSDPISMGYTLYTTLKKMISNNEEQEGLVRDDWEYAFAATPIIEHTPTATVSGSKYRLERLHLEAHNQIGEFFHGHSCYAMGLNAAFDAELGKRGLKHAFELTGIVALSVLCPPVGIGIGLGVSVVEISHTYRQKRLYGSLLNPEVIISQAQVEFDLYVAWIGAILNVVPEVGTFFKPASAGVKAGLAEGVGAELRAVEQEVAGATKSAGAELRAAEKHLVGEAAGQAAEAVSQQFIEHFAVTLVSAAVMEQVTQIVISPVAEYFMKELDRTHSVGGGAGAEALIDQITERFERESLQE